LTIKDIISDLYSCIYHIASEKRSKKATVCMWMIHILMVQNLKILLLCYCYKHNHGHIVTDFQVFK